MLVPAATSIGMRCSSSQRMTPDMRDAARAAAAERDADGRPSRDLGQRRRRQLVGRWWRDGRGALQRRGAARARGRHERHDQSAAPHAPVLVPFSHRGALICDPLASLQNGLEPYSPRIWRKTPTCRGSLRFARRRAPESGCGGKGHVLYPIGRRCVLVSGRPRSPKRTPAGGLDLKVYVSPVFRRRPSTSGGALPVRPSSVERLACVFFATKPRVCKVRPHRRGPPGRRRHAGCLRRVRLPA